MHTYLVSTPLPEISNRNIQFNTLLRDEGPQHVISSVVTPEQVVRGARVSIRSERIDGPLIAQVSQLESATDARFTYHITNVEALVTPNQPVQDTIQSIGAYTFTRNTRIRFDQPETMVVTTDGSLATIDNALILEGPYIPVNRVVAMPTPTQSWTYMYEQAIATGDDYGESTYNREFTLDVDESPVEPTEPKKPEIRWSSTRTKSVNFIADYLTTQIRVRYAMFDRPRNGLSNVVVDSFIPRLLVASKMNVVAACRNANFPATAVTISPWFANMFGIKQMSPEQMARFVGYTPAMIKDLFAKVKRKNWAITFIGYGGTNVNTLHWLTELANMTHTVSPFKYVEIYENDNTDISNLLRFPKDPGTAIQNNFGRNKLSLLTGELETLSRLKPDYQRRYYNPARPHYGQRDFIKRTPVYEELTDAQKEDEAAGRWVNRRRLMDENHEYVYEVEHTDEKHIYYGAPNIETRVALSEVGNFISATHGSNDCSLHLNPTQDTELQVESYGMIQLASFFMNQMRMAIGLLETLADDNFNPAEKDKPLMEFSFDGIAKKPTDRNYNFQLDFAGMMLDENDAANI